MRRIADRRENATFTYGFLTPAVANAISAMREQSTNKQRERLLAEMYRPSEEHEAFRAAVRELCEEKVAPNAAEADELAEFPKASYEALVSADFHAPHIPEAYSGVGADALATVIVIEEIARACAATLTDPGSQQARHVAMAARRIRGDQADLSAADRSRRSDGVYCLSGA